jgi:hypothetical protein
MSALAAALTAAAPSLVGVPALADPPRGDTLDAALHTAKTHDGTDSGAKPSPSKPRAKQRATAMHERGAGRNEGLVLDEAMERSKAKQDAAALEAKGKKGRKPGSRAAGKGKKTARRSTKDAPKRPCLGDAIAIDRTGIEGQTMRLVDCHHEPLASGRVALSVLARPWGARKPDVLPKLTPAPAATAREGIARGSNAPATSSPHGAEEVAPGVRLLDIGLLRRLDAVAQRFPGKPLSLVSGYRPQSRGSQHQTGRALDFRVAGVSNEEFVAFCKTLRDTGCGYYPNSSFVHMDVRNPGTGSVSWIDASGPGEGPQYVRRWPPAPDEGGQPALPRGASAHDGGDDPWADLDDPHPVAPASVR